MACAARRRKSAVPAPRKIPRPARGAHYDRECWTAGLACSARLGVGVPCPGIAVLAPPLPATRLGRGTPAPGLRSPRVSVGCPRPRFTSFFLPSSSPHLCLCWLHPTGPNPGVPARPLRQGLAPRRSEGGLRGKRPMSIEKRVLPGMGGGCGV